MNTVSHTLKGFAEKTTVKQNFFTKILINGQMLIQEYSNRGYLETAVKMFPQILDVWQL